MTEKPLNGRRALVTGAGRGIGRSVALRFARAGADLVICARSESQLSDVAQEAEDLGVHCLAVAGDVSDPGFINSLVNKVSAATDKLHLLVNNAGVYPDRGAFADSDPDDWWRTIEVNVRGPYLLTRHLLPLMPAGAKIINLTSGKGYAAGVNSSSYHVSKAALNMFTSALANELWQRDIDVNNLVPGPTATTTFSRDDPASGVNGDDILKRIDGNLPKGLPAWERVKHPDEVAELALQLASYQAGGPTGQVFSLARRPLS